MGVAAGSASSVGQIRLLNEDSYYIGAQLWAVADGMGGQAAGDIASSLVVESLKSWEDSGFVPDIPRFIDSVNNRVLRYAEDNPQARGLGSTICGVMETTIGEMPHFVIFNVGDSRVYRYSAQTLRRETHDHNEAQELVDAGMLTLEQAANSPHRSVLTQSIGQLPPPTVDVMILPRLAGDRLLICSDGLPLELEDWDIQQLLAADAQPATIAEQLVEQAVNRGGRDNTTAVVLFVEGESALVEDTIPRGIRS